MNLNVDISDTFTYISDLINTSSYNFDLNSLYKNILTENNLSPYHKNHILKIILKINIIFYLPEDKLRENLEMYEKLATYQERSYLTCILYFMTNIHKSFTFETIKNKASESLFSLLSIISFINDYDNLHLNKHFISLNYLHEELVYYIISFNKFKHIISCFDSFMKSSKLQYDHKDEMSNHLLMSNFVKLWSLDFSNDIQTEETMTINLKPQFKVLKQDEDIFKIKALKQDKLNSVIPLSSNKLLTFALLKSQNK